MSGVLSGQELDLLHSMISGVSNVTSYSYEIMIRGTVVDGIATLVCSIIGILLTILAAKKMLNWAKNEGDGGAYMYACLGIFITLVCSIAMFYILLHGPFMSIFAPEYIVINKIITAAAGVAI